MCVLVQDAMHTERYADGNRRKCHGGTYVGPDYVPWQTTSSDPLEQPPRGRERWFSSVSVEV